jgi:hypothetical protein
LLQTLGDDSYRGRLIGAVMATASATGLIGAIAAGGLADRVGVIPVIAIQGFGYMIAGAVVLFLIERESERRAAAARNEWS